MIRHLGLAGLICAILMPLPSVAAMFQPPAELAGSLEGYTSPLVLPDGTRITTPAQWRKQREVIRKTWHDLMGPWPPLLKAPRVEWVKAETIETYVRHRVRVEVAPGQMQMLVMLVPRGDGPFPAVIVPFYETETSTGQGKPLRDFALQLTRRGFVTLSIGSPGGDAREPDAGKATCQPLSFLAYVAANCHTMLSWHEMVDPKRIGIVGHSYGGKWAMFASCLYDKFACAAWSDPGIVFDESRGNVNYWDRWYLGAEPGRRRPPGKPTDKNPRTGAYKVMRERGHDLHELHALMAPRPFLVSGGSEDPPERWRALNHTIAVNRVLGQTNRVGMTNRKGHGPTEESNLQVYLFFEQFLKPAQNRDP